MKEKKDKKSAENVARGMLVSVDIRELANLFPKTRDPDRIGFSGSMEDLVMEEMALFSEVTGKLLEIGSLSHDDFDWLEKEFKKYFEKLVSCCKEMSEEFSLAKFFERIPSNGWMIIRRELISRVIRKEKEKKDKERRVAH